MARYVLSHRRVGVRSSSRKAAIRAEASQAFSTLFEASADVVGVMQPEEEARREVIVFDASPTEVVRKREELGPDVLLEEEILHRPAATVLSLDSVGGDPGARKASAGTGQKLGIVVRGPAGPLEGAEVILALRAVESQVQELKATTDAAGKVSFEYGAPWAPAVVVAVPAGDHWPTVLRGPGDGATVEAPELPRDSDVWWHRQVGAKANVGDGLGVTVGVADSGLGPHPHLLHMTSVGAFVEGGHHADAAAGHDVDSHGTHVCGTIGARTAFEKGWPSGIAPSAELYCARVFPESMQANQADIANAIDHLSSVREADLINLSLGAPRASQIEREAIAEAAEGGTLTICAAANSAGPVEFPAAFPESVAVSALGLQGWPPPQSVSATRYPQEQDKYARDQLFLANFSCFGPEIDCAAPGVGVIAPVPERFGLTAPYAAMDGTSMAAPVTCGALAAALSHSPDYLDLPRDLSRAAEARAILEKGCRDVGLAVHYQGRGIPQA